MAALGQTKSQGSLSRSIPFSAPTATSNRLRGLWAALLIKILAQEDLSLLLSWYLVVQCQKSRRGACSGVRRRVPSGCGGTAVSLETGCFKAGRC